MYPHVRIALVGLALLAAAAVAFFARKAISANLIVLKSWTAAEGAIAAMPASDRVEVRLGPDRDERPIVVAPLHSLGLSVFKKVRVYVDPADPKHVQFGGLLQMWLLPAILAIATMLFLVCAVVAARAGSAGPAPPMAADILVRPPASEVTAPLFWSLLGVAALASGVFSSSAGILPRLGLSAIGVALMLFTLSLSLISKTMEVRADANGMRKMSAFGWREVRWDQIARVEKRTSSPAPQSKPGFFLSYDSSLPGRDTVAYVFSDRGGWPLMRLSVVMEPASSMRRLLDLCEKKTGLSVERTKTYVPDF